MSSKPNRRALLKGAVLSPLALAAGCGGGGGGRPRTRSISYQWTQATLEAVSATKPGPPICARAIAMVATAAYDAWACYDPVAVGTRLGGTLRRPATERTTAAKEQAISYAAYRVALDLFPTQKAALDALMVRLGYNPNDTSLDVTTPTGIGNRVAAELLEFRHQDGSNQLNGYADTTGYQPRNTPDVVVDPSRWQQLRFANGASPEAIAPHWGNVIPFALTSPSAVRPVPPPVFGSPTYRAQIQEVIDLTAALDDRKKVIAEFWADGPGTVLPPGHWQIFGQFVSDRDRHNLDQDVQLFFMLGNAVFDAGIACWECKYVYDTSRPITAIRFLYAGQRIPSFAGPNLGIRLVDGSQWLPYQSVDFITPPFPEYTSGHSTFSAAAAEILKRFTRSDYFGNGVTVSAGWSGFEVNVPARPVTLRWETFTHAANEAGASRRYGGIHIEAGDIEGRRCGRIVADLVWDKARAYIEGAMPTRRA